MQGGLRASLVIARQYHDKECYERKIEYSTGDRQISIHLSLY